MLHFVILFLLISLKKKLRYFNHIYWLPFRVFWCNRHWRIEIYSEFMNNSQLCVNAWAVSVVENYICRSFMTILGACPLITIEVTRTLSLTRNRWLKQCRVITIKIIAISLSCLQINRFNSSYLYLLERLFIYIQIFLYSYNKLKSLFVWNSYCIWQLNY